MNDRIFEALTAAGLSTSPLSTLDHAQANAFFALYNDELVYHEAGRSSRVPLRDVTRIHSDREGMLRVETSERTAVTASLLGYDPGRVQAFFQQVRDVTARAKELPVVPLHQAPLGQPKVEPAVRTVTGSSIPSAGLAGAGLSGTGLANSSLPNSSLAGLSDAALSSAAMPGISAYTPAVAPVAPVVVTPAPLAPTSQSSLPPVTPAVGAVRATPPELSKTSLPQLPAEPTATAPQAPRPEPVVISSMPPVSSPPPFQERAGERARQATRAAPVAEAAVPVATAAAAHVHTQGALVSVPAPSSFPGDPSSASQGGELLRRADSVQSLARTVGLLAVVLGLAALALTYFQWQAGSSLVAIWTLLAGGVGAVALLAFAEALRLLAAMARSRQQE